MLLIILYIVKTNTWNSLLHLSPWKLQVYADATAMVKYSFTYVGDIVNHEYSLISIYIFGRYVRCHGYSLIYINTWNEDTLV